MSDTVQAHIVLYVKKDGSVEAGQVCSTPQCAVASVHPDEQAITLGPYTFNIDETKDIFKRADTLTESDAGVIMRNLFGQYHHRVE